MAPDTGVRQQERPTREKRPVPPTGEEFAKKDRGFEKRSHARKERRRGRVEERRGKR